MDNSLKVYKKHKVKSYISVPSIVTIHYFEFAKDYKYDGESHDFWELVYVDKGEIIATADTEDVVLKQGEVLFHKPYEFHKLRSNGVSAPNVFIISFVCSDEAMKYFEGKHIAVPARYRALISDIIAESQNTYALPIFDRNMKELKSAKTAAFGGSQIIKMRLEELLIRLYREGEKHMQGNNKRILPNKAHEAQEKGTFGSTKAKSGSLVPDEADEQLTARIIEIIKQEGIYSNINLDRICLKVNYGKTYICTRFKQVCGYAIVEYINILKIDEAKRLIREKNYNFTQISNMLAFNNPHYFSKVFKKITGLSPREYSRTVNKYASEEN